MCLASPSHLILVAVPQGSVTTFMFTDEESEAQNHITSEEEGPVTKLGLPTPGPAGQDRAA